MLIIKNTYATIDALFIIRFIMHTDKSPMADIVHIFTEDEFRENYWSESLQEYLDKYQIEIQSEKQLSNGSVSKFSHKEIGKIWWDILETLLKWTMINLWQMMRNYQTAPNSHLKSGIAEKIINVVPPEVIVHDEQNEALMLWICMLFGDDAVADSSNTLIAHMHNKISHIIDFHKSESQHAA